MQSLAERVLGRLNVGGGSGSLARSTAVLALALLATRLLGLVREVVVAATYGTGPEADAFSVAANLVNLTLGLAGGSIAAVLIPRIARLRAERRDLDIRELLGALFGRIGLCALVLGGAVYVFAEPIAGVYVPGFAEPTRSMVVDMLRIAAPALVVVTLGAFCAAVLNGEHRYAVPGLAPALVSGSVVVAALVFAPAFGPLMLAFGLTLGWSLHLVVLAAFASRLRPFRPRLTLSTEAAAMMRQGLPLLAGAAVFAANTLVDRTMASLSGEGVAAALGYAERVVYLPLGLVLGPYVVPLSTAMAEAAADGNVGALRTLLGRSFRLASLTLLPVTAVLFLCAGPLVEILFARAAFDAESTRLTGLALMGYSLMLAPFAFRDVLTRAFYAVNDTATPLVANLLMVAANVVLMILFVPRFGIIAIAASTSASLVVSALFLYWRLNRKFGFTSNGEFASG